MPESNQAASLPGALLALERAALDRWVTGDPDGYLDLYAEDVTYFDPFVAGRAGGIAAMRSLYEPYRGKIRIDRDEIASPLVQILGGAAVLTMQYVSHRGGTVTRWNCTEVYRQSDRGWKIVHSHWSLTQPALAPPQAADSPAAGNS